MRLSQNKVSISRACRLQTDLSFSSSISHRRPSFLSLLSSLPLLLTDLDASHLLAAVEASRASDGRVAPHPRSGCVIVDGKQQVLSSGHTAGEGASPSEVVAVSALGGSSASSSSSASSAPLSVYLSLEPDATPAGAGALEALLALGSNTRVVLGMLHPLAHARGRGAAALAAAGFEVHRSPAARRRSPATCEPENEGSREAAAAAARASERARAVEAAEDGEEEAVAAAMDASSAQERSDAAAAAAVAVVVVAAAAAGAAAAPPSLSPSPQLASSRRCCCRCCCCSIMRLCLRRLLASSAAEESGRRFRLGSSLPAPPPRPPPLPSPPPSEVDGPPLPPVPVPPAAAAGPRDRGCPAAALSSMLRLPLRPMGLEEGGA